MYASDNSGAYPATSNFATALIPAYLNEIPNNPFTSLQGKVTHREEAVDWFYQNNSGTITLAPKHTQSNPRTKPKLELIQIKRLSTLFHKLVF